MVLDASVRRRWRGVKEAQQPKKSPSEDPYLTRSPKPSRWLMSEFVSAKISWRSSKTSSTNTASSRTHTHTSKRAASPSRPSWNSRISRQSIFRWGHQQSPASRHISTTTHSRSRAAEPNQRKGSRRLLSRGLSCSRIHGKHSRGRRSRSSVKMVPTKTLTPFDRPPWPSSKIKSTIEAQVK